MQSSIIMDEYWTFGNNDSGSSARGHIDSPTFALSVQDLDNPNINAWKLFKETLGKKRIFKNPLEKNPSFSSTSFSEVEKLVFHPIKKNFFERPTINLGFEKLLYIIGELNPGIFRANPLNTGFGKFSRIMLFFGNLYQKMRIL